VRTQDTTRLASKDEVRIPVDHDITCSNFRLEFPFTFQRPLDLRCHGNDPDPSFRLGRAYQKFAGTSRLFLPVEQAVIDGDGFLRKIAVLPPQADDLTHAAARPQHDSEQRSPLPVSNRVGNKLHKRSLLCLCQCVFLGSLPLVPLFDISQNTVRGIGADQVVPDCQREDRVQKGVDSLHGVGPETVLPQ